MEHIYYCKYLNQEIPEEKFDRIFCGNTRQQKKILKRFEENLIKKRIKENELTHVIPFGDPPFSVVIENGNGL